MPVMQLIIRATVAEVRWHHTTNLSLMFEDEMLLKLFLKEHKGQKLKVTIEPDDTTPR